MKTDDLIHELRTRARKCSDPVVSAALFELAEKVESAGVDPASSRHLLVYPAGTAVKVAGNIDGTIKQVSIYPGESVCYEVAWWDGARRVRDWFLPEELTFDPLARPMRRGFRPGGA